MSKKIILAAYGSESADASELVAANLSVLRGASEDISFPQNSNWHAFRTWFDQIGVYMPDPVYLKDRDSRFVLANPALEKQFHAAGIRSVLGLSDLDLHSQEIAEEFYKDEQLLMAENKAMIAKEEFLVLPDGRNLWVSTTKVPLSDDEGEVVGLFGIGHDITRQKSAELLRKGQGHVLEKIALGKPLAEVLTDLLLLIEEHVQDVKASILLLSADGKHLHHGAAPNLPKAYCEAIDGVAIGPVVGSCGTAAFLGTPVVVADIANDPLWADYKHVALAHGLTSCASTPIISPTGQVLGTFAMYTDGIAEPSDMLNTLIDETTRIAAIAIERDLAQSKIRFLAENDPLTKLPNRAMLEREITGRVKERRATDGHFALVFVDLDRFKNVNDTLGHPAGDRVLKIVADRLLACVRPSDFVARFGGDEFVVLMAETDADPNHIRPVLDRIQAAITEPIAIEEQAFQICSSLGVALYPQDGEDATTLLKHADDAMYKAKALGRNCFKFYSSKYSDDDARKLTLLRDIRVGIEEEQFFLEYQPQVEVDTNKITGVEALVRWNHPELGRVPPGKFIMEAEESGLISELGNWVLVQACKQGKMWQDGHSTPVAVSVNVSAHQFLNGDLVERVSEAIMTTGFDAGLLELELTESSLVKDPELCSQMMNKLSMMGIRVALDDFGTGYSSLSTLRSFPLDRLKIDRSFVQNMDKGCREKGIVRAIVAMGQELNMRVIAEGVETADQLQVLKAMGCRQVQGYYTGKPMPPGSVSRKLQDDVSA